MSEAREKAARVAGAVGLIKGWETVNGPITPEESLRYFTELEEYLLSREYANMTGTAHHYVEKHVEGGVISIRYFLKLGETYYDEETGEEITNLESS